mmetsp:Transcript_26994/g.64448  ORF Transcript_26994/g.64448 Transcript_26994/m.64448 type:complete len:175 (+) Transcript_26994:1957-2481(+)
MWSVGVVLYVMLVGYTPFMDDNQERMFERIKLGDWKFDKLDWSHVSEEAKDLIKNLMNTNVDKRMTASRALRSKWISTMTDKQLSSNDLSMSMRKLKIGKPNLIKEIGNVFAVLNSTGKKARKGLSTVASSTLATSHTAFKSTSSTTPSMDKTDKSDKSSGNGNGGGGQDHEVV